MSENETFVQVIDNKSADLGLFFSQIRFQFLNRVHVCRVFCETQPKRPDFEKTKPVSRYRDSNTIFTPAIFRKQEKVKISTKMENFNKTFLDLAIHTRE